jgi:hypothetical protein
MTQDYAYKYHTYPVYSEEMAIEGAVKRYTSFPTPVEVFEYAMLGMPKYFPMTKQAITSDLMIPFLNSAITDIEMELGCNLSEVVHYHSDDFIDGMFSNNYMGMRLQRWPATQIVKMSLKYPHTNTQNVYQQYTIPPTWIYLRRNKVNVIAAMGSVTVSTDNTALVAAGGIFQYITGFGRGSYQPGMIEIVYKAGFEHDKLPSSVADLIKTWAAARFLGDVIAPLFPSGSVDVRVDGVSQGVSYAIPQMLLKRLEHLEKKKAELKASFKGQFARSVKMTFIGA